MLPLPECDYPEWICNECARECKGRKSVISWHEQGICHVCNEWKSISPARDYGYPQLSANYNKGKIMAQLEKVASIFRAEGNIQAAQIVEEKLIEVKLS